jgi:pyruvate dehydrogenase E1 component beta subunit
MAQLNLVEAINRALREELERDTSVLLLGEDVGKEGGVFRVTEGLQQAFGEERVIDTPLAESGIVGVAFGMALLGLRPVAELQFMGFLPPALDQIISHVGRMRNRSRGEYSAPLVIRMPYGGGIHAPEHHSESNEAILAHIPGIKVVIPSTPADALGLLKSAIRDPDPVLFLEPKRIYRAVKGEVPDGEISSPSARPAWSGRAGTSPWSPGGRWYARRKRQPKNWPAREWTRRSSTHGPSRHLTPRRSSPR